MTENPLKDGFKYLIEILEHGWLPQFSDYYIDMELCAYNLDAWIRNNEPVLDPSNSVMQDILSYEYDLWRSELGELLDEIMIIMLQIAKGLELIHSCKLVHRDLNPRNGIRAEVAIILMLVLFSVRDKVWKIADFGFTTTGTSKTLLVTTNGRGTPSYRAPELLDDPPRFASKVDIWAFGCIVFEIATGKRAFRNDWDVQIFAVSGNAFPIPPLPFLPKINETFRKSHQ